MQPLVDSDAYYVTMCGKVFSKERRHLLTGRHKTPYERVYPERQLNPYKAKNGYEYVGIWNKGAKLLKLVHRLVAETYISNPENKKEVNHKDGNPSNNIVSNLEWVSRSENALHSTRVLKKNRGEDNYRSILTEADVLAIKKDLEEGLTQTEVAKRYNVTNHAIFRIHRGYNWSWLTGYERKDGPNVYASTY